MVVYAFNLSTRESKQMDLLCSKLVQSKKKKKKRDYIVNSPYFLDEEVAVHGVGVHIVTSSSLIF